MLLIGHNKQKKYFDNLIANKTLSHAYLFAGPDMIGKRTFALELAIKILGKDIDQNPDFKFIGPKVEDGESKIYIEDVRNLKKFLALKSYSGGSQIVVIDEADRLTSEASNALLKILEEPPAGATIILVSSMPDLLLSTIISRCEEVKFVPVDDRALGDYLSEEKRLRQEDRDFVIKLSGGKIGFAKMLIKGKRLDEAKKAVDDLRKLFKAGTYAKMEYAKKVNETAVQQDSPRGPYQSLVGYWLYWVSAHVSSSPKNKKIVEDLLSLHQLVSQPQFNHRLALENFLLNL